MSMLFLKAVFDTITLRPTTDANGENIESKSHYIPNILNADLVPEGVQETIGSAFSPPASPSRMAIRENHQRKRVNASKRDQAEDARLATVQTPLPDTTPRINKKFADYSTRAPIIEHPPFLALHEDTGVWDQISVIHIKELAWDANPMEWITFNSSFEIGSAQQRPRDWPKAWQWPFEVMRNRDVVDGPCLNCAKGAREPCMCIPSQWRHKIDWEPLRVLFYTQDAGIGVKTRTAWKKGDILGDYVGVLRPYNNVERNNYSMVVPLRKPSCSPHIAMIDATKAGNWTRFTNHTTEDPNLETTLARVGSQRLFVFRARRDIRLGEELRWNYGCYWHFESEEEPVPDDNVAASSSVSYDKLGPQNNNSNTNTSNDELPKPRECSLLKNCSRPNVKSKAPIKSATGRAVKKRVRTEGSISDSNMERAATEQRKSRRPRVETAKGTAFNVRVRSWDD